MIEELRVRPDITLAVDGDGVIRSAVSAERLAGEVLDPWRGLPWKDTLTPELARGQACLTINSPRLASEPG